jgi:adenine/guanine phosphoribosyltransferase-like PRPP-binding protein
MNENEGVIGMNGHGVLLNCEQADELLSAFYDDELPEAKRAEVARHLKVCETCERTLDKFRELSKIFATPPLDPRPPRSEKMAAKIPSRNGYPSHGEAAAPRLLEEVPPFLRESLHTDGPTLFPGAGVAPGAWEFGLLNDLPPGQAQPLINAIAERAYEKLQPIMTAEDPVIVCFGAPVHRCGMRLARIIAEKHGSEPHVVMADGYSNPTLECDPSELKNKRVIVFVDIVRTGGSIERLGRLCQESQAREVFGLAIIDQAYQDPPHTPRYALWTEARKKRIRFEDFKARGDDALASLRYFDPETCRATADLPAEVATPEAACQTVKECLEALQPLQPFIEKTDAMRTDTRIQGVFYPSAIDTLCLLRDPEARRELISRAAAGLRDLQSAGPWCIVYPAARHQRAGALAEALHAELGWPIVEVGRKNQKHFHGLTADQAEKLATHGRVVVVDAMFRTGKTLQSLVHVLKKRKIPLVKEIVAFYLFDGSWGRTRESLQRELAVPIRSLFRLPLGQPTEPARDHWHRRLKDTLNTIKNDQAPWAEVLRHYCEVKLHRDSEGNRLPVFRPKKSLGCNAEAEVRQAIEEGVVGPRERLKHARESGRGAMVKCLDVAALREPMMHNLVHATVCNSTPMPVVESLVLGLATQDDYGWLDYDWLILHRNLFADGGSERWRFLVCIAYWIKQRGDHEIISRVSTALKDFSSHVEPGSLFPDRTRQERCGLMSAALS